MATEVRFRRGNAAEHEQFTGALAEVTVNTSENALHVHDGSTPGGNKTVMESQIGTNPEQVPTNELLGTAAKADIGVDPEEVPDIQTADARYLLPPGTKGVAEIDDDGILELIPADGRRVRLEGHGSARHVIRGFGAQCPVGWEVEIHIPRTIPDVGGTPNERGQAVVFSDARSGPGLDMTKTAYTDDGVVVYGYEAYPDATDKDGARCALDERLTFVHRGEGRWELVELPDAAEGRNSTGSWERHALGRQVVYADDLTIGWVDRVEWLRSVWTYPVRCEFGPASGGMMLPVPSGAQFTPDQARIRNNSGLVGISALRLGEEVWIGVNRGSEDFEYEDTDEISSVSAYVTCRWKPNPWTGSLLAHRGRNSLDDAENVVESLSTLSPWVAGVEVDVRFSSDGVPVLMHDATVDRTTSGSGAVDSFTLAQLKALEAGMEVGGGATVPTLEEYLQACEGEGFRWIFLDLKGADTQARIEAVIDVVAASPLQNRCILAPPSSDLPQGLIWARNYNQDVILGRLSLDENTLSDVLAQADTFDMPIALSSVSGGGYLDHRSAVAAFKSAGYLAGASTTNDLDALERAKADNASIIFTDIAGELGALFGS